MSQRLFIEPGYYPFSRLNQTAARESSILPPLGSSEATLLFRQKRSKISQAMVQSCTRGGLDWTLGGISLLRGWLNT